MPAQYDSLEDTPKMPTNTEQNPVHLDKKVVFKKKYTIQAFTSQIIHCWTKKTMMVGYQLHVMTQALYLEDEAHLPNSMYMLKTYTELKDSSQNVSIILWNLTGKPVHLFEGFW